MLGWKGLSVSNTLSNMAHLLVTKEKKFVNRDPGTIFAALKFFYSVSMGKAGHSRLYVPFVSNKEEKSL